MVYIAKLPFVGELRTTCARTLPLRGLGREVALAAEHSPVASSQFSAKAPWRSFTAGPSMRDVGLPPLPF